MYLYQTRKKHLFYGHLSQYFATRYANQSYSNVHKNMFCMTLSQICHIFKKNIKKNQDIFGSIAPVEQGFIFRRLRLGSTNSLLFAFLNTTLVLHDSYPLMFLTFPIKTMVTGPDSPFSGPWQKCEALHSRHWSSYRRVLNSKLSQKTHTVEYYSLILWFRLGRVIVEYLFELSDFGPLEILGPGPGPNWLVQESGPEWSSSKSRQRLKFC